MMRPFGRRHDAMASGKRGEELEVQDIGRGRWQGRGSDQDRSRWGETPGEPDAVGDSHETLRGCSSVPAREYARPTHARQASLSAYYGLRRQPAEAKRSED